MDSDVEDAVNRGSAGQARETLKADYPDGEIGARREFGSLCACARTGGGVVFFAAGDGPGILAAVLGVGPDDVPGDGGQVAAIGAVKEEAA